MELKKVLEQFKESQPWLNWNLYNYYYIKHNLPPQTVIANRDDLQLISAINKSTTNPSTSSDTEQKKRTMGGQPKGFTNESQAAVSIQFSLVQIIYPLNLTRKTKHR